MSQISKHYVTTKAAIYSEDDSGVLVIDTRSYNNSYGLPGGHVDMDEAPDQTIEREINEELGIIVSNLERRDFFLHGNGKVVLAYIAKAPIEVSIAPLNTDEGIGVWKTKEQFEKIDIDEGYKKFVLDNWSKG